MTVTPVWTGVVTAEGKLRLDSRLLFLKWLQRFRGKPIKLTVRRMERPKTRSQQGYLFGVVYPILADHLGYRDYEVSEVHDAVMRHLRGLRPEPNPLQLRVSLAEMSLEELSAYIEDVRHFALLSHGCVTPDAEKAEA